MSVWLCHQIYKNNFFKHIFNLFPLMIPGDSAALSDGAEAFFLVWRLTQKYSHTQRWECARTNTHAPGTFKNLDKCDHRWQEGGLHLVCRLLLCCYVDTPSRTGRFPTLAPCFALKFFLNALRRTKWHLLPLPNHTCSTTTQKDTHTLPI